MKKFFLTLIAGTFIFCSCSKTPEEKAEVLVKNYLTESLSDPTSYKPIETKLDSAFYPMDDSLMWNSVYAFIYTKDQWGRFEYHLADLENTVINDKRITTFSIANKKHFMDLEKSKKKLKDYIANVNAYINYMDSAQTKVKEAYEAPKRFIGYRVSHKYRSMDDLGNNKLHESYIVLNEDMTKVLGAIRKTAYDSIQSGIETFKNVTIPHKINSKLVH